MAGIMHMLLSSASSIVTDAYFNLVTLLLPGNGTNGAQNNDFVDSSSNNFSITRNGNTTQGTFSPFSQTGWSNYFNAASNKLSTTGMTALGSDFTLELWVNPSSFADYNTLFDNRTTDGDANGIAFGLTSAAKVYFYSNASFLITTATAISANAWTHIALVRSGSGSGNVKIYINGVADANTATYTTSITRTAPSIGDDWNTRSNLQFYGYLSNMRATTAALYTSNFTPSLVPLTTSVSSGTCVLLTCQSNRFIDNSASALAITVTGTPSVQAFSPFAPTAAYSATTNGGSGYFDGSGDYLSIASTSALAFGTGDFTVECWLNFAALPSSAKGILNGQSLGSFNFYYDGGTYASKIFSIGNRIVGQISYSFTPAINTWYHVAVTRSGTTLSLFINGSLATSVTSSTDYGTAAFDIGGDGGGGGTWSWNGYISNLRVVKGTAVYTGSTYTVPTAPLTAITNTQLLLLCTNAGIIDNAAKNDLETVGNAQISTTQSKFGGSSMYFDGTGDGLLTTNSPQLTFGSSNFTIEFWIYRSGSGVIQGIFDERTAAATETRPTIYVTTSNLIAYFTSGVDRITASLSQNTWVHVAVVKSSNVTTMYIDGVSAGTYSDTNSYLSPTNGVRIGYLVDGYSLNGFIDDFRVTNGYARYTSNFTVPSAAFPLS